MSVIVIELITLDEYRLVTRPPHYLDCHLAERVRAGVLVRHGRAR